MALENPALNERSFQRGIEEAGAEPRGMSASGTCSSPIFFDSPSTKTGREASSVCIS